jgi:hypothetical protein
MQGKLVRNYGTSDVSAPPPIVTLPLVAFALLWWLPIRIGSISGAPVTLGDIGALLITAAVVLAWLGGSARPGGWIPLGLSLAILPTLLVAPALPVAARLALNLIVGVGLACAYSVALRDSFQLRRAVGYSLAISGFCVTGTLVLIGLRDSFAELHQAADLTWGRSNYVSAVSLLAGLIAFGLLRSSGIGVAKACAVMAGCAAAPLLTLSRGSILALGVGLAVVALQELLRAGSQTRVTVLCVAAVATLFAVPLLQSGWDDLTEIRAMSSDLEGNQESRVILWRLGWKDGADSLLVGNGPGSLRVRTLAELGYEMTHAHNMFISAFQQGGILWLSLLMYALWRMRRSMLPRPSNPYAAAAVTAIVIAQYEVLIEGWQGGWMFWTALGLGASTAHVPRREQPTLARETR